MIIDHIDGNIAVVKFNFYETISFCRVPLQELPEHVKKGDVLRIEIDEKMTQMRKEGMEKLLKDMLPYSVNEVDTEKIL